MAAAAVDVVVAVDENHKVVAGDVDDEGRAIVAAAVPTADAVDVVADVAESDADVPEEEIGQMIVVDVGADVDDADDLQWKTLEDAAGAADVHQMNHLLHHHYRLLCLGISFHHHYHCCCCPFSFHDHTGY